MPILPEPDWNTSVPTISYHQQSALCLVRPAPSVITGVILQLLRAQFSDPDNIVDTKLKGYIWEDDDTEGHTINARIQIEPSYKFKPETTQQRPSVLVCRDTMGHKEFLINNGPAPYTEPRSGNYEQDHKYTVISGKHNIECCGKTQMEADRLSEEIFFRMLEYKQVIKDDLNFSEFDVTLLKGPEKVDENHIHWKAVLDIEWKFVYHWGLAPVSPVLKRIGQEFRVY